MTKGCLRWLLLCRQYTCSGTSYAWWGFCDIRINFLHNFCNLLDVEKTTRYCMAHRPLKPVGHVVHIRNHNRELLVFGLGASKWLLRWWWRVVLIPSLSVQDALSEMVCTGGLNGWHRLEGLRHWCMKKTCICKGFRKLGYEITRFQCYIGYKKLHWFGPDRAMLSRLSWWCLAPEVRSTTTIRMLQLHFLDPMRRPEYLLTNHWWFVLWLDDQFSDWPVYQPTILERFFLAQVTA